jgi:leader peptidase (prepilin peptidase)/N-methyltransferase
LTWKSALFGVLLGAGILYSVAWIYYFWRKEAGLGMGDVKLLAGIGGWLGYESVFPTLMIASITGAIFGMLAIALSRGSKNLKTAIPFGPFIAFGAFFHFLFLNQILDYFASVSTP